MRPGWLELRQYIPVSGQEVDLCSLFKAMGHKGTVQSVVRDHSLAMYYGTHLGSPCGQWVKRESSLKSHPKKIRIPIKIQPHLELAQSYTTCKVEKPQAKETNVKTVPSTEKKKTHPHSLPTEIASAQGTQKSHKRQLILKRSSQKRQNPFSDRTKNLQIIEQCERNLKISLLKVSKS